MEFRYTTENAKDCILYTEAQLRDVVSAILTRKHGAGWEDDSTIGWSKSKKDELEARLEAKKKQFPNETLSNRLIDYSYVLDLKYLICKSRDLFESIFAPWNRTMMLFDKLGELRNRVMHPEPVPIHLQHLTLGICGEFLLAAERWNKGFSHSIAFYACDIRFDETEEGDADGAKSRCIEAANRWIDAIKQLSGEEIKIEKHQEYGEMYIIKLPHGFVKIALSTVSRYYYGDVYTQAANVILMTESLDALDLVISKGNHPYWTLHWNLTNGIDLASLVSVIKETTGVESSGGTCYYIDKDDRRKVRVDLHKVDNNSTRMVLVYDGGRPNEGFWEAHKVFSPDLILAILYGEISTPKKRELVRQSCKT